LADIRASTLAIQNEITNMARDVIRSYQDLGDRANQSFLEEPDAREQHQTRWHQWGIISHTQVFLRYFDVQVPRYLKEWSLEKQVDTALRETIDGVSKRDLLRIAILLHDIGKFATRTQGKYRFHFQHHESASGQIIREQLNLERFGLTQAQIEYVALTAEDHFVLALLRKRAREQGGYDVPYIHSRQFSDHCQEIKQAHLDDFVEIGVLFLGDSLAKANPGEGPEDALSQYDLNILVARRYLEVVLER
jgi:hypothetical protein